MAGIQTPPTTVYIDLDLWEPGQLTASIGGVGGRPDTITANLRPGGHVDMWKWVCRGGNEATGDYYHANNRRSGNGNKNRIDVPKQGEHTESLQSWRRMKDRVKTRRNMSWQMTHLEESGHGGLGSCEAVSGGNGSNGSRDLSRATVSKRKRRMKSTSGQRGDRKQVKSSRICRVSLTPTTSTTTTKTTTTAITTPATITTSSSPELGRDHSPVDNQHRDSNGDNSKLRLHDPRPASTPISAPRIHPVPTAELLRSRLRLALYKIHTKQAKRPTAHLAPLSHSSDPQYCTPYMGGDVDEEEKGSSEDSRGYSPTTIYPITTNTTNTSRRVTRETMWECYLPQAISGREESPELGEYAFSEVMQQLVSLPPSLPRGRDRKSGVEGSVRLGYGGK